MFCLILSNSVRYNCLNVCPINESLVIFGNSAKMPKENCKFKKKWLNEEKFEVWLISASSLQYAHCKLCDTDISVINDVGDARKKHAAGKVHLDLETAAKQSQKSLSALNQQRISKHLKMFPPLRQQQQQQ